MNKYLFPIKNLKIPAYLKWWLMNKSAKVQYEISELLEGTSFYLEDSVNKEFNLFKITGNKEQYSTTGKNLFDCENPTSLYKATTNFVNNILTVSSTENVSSTSAKWDFENLTEGDTIQLNCIILDSTGQIVLQKYNGSTWATVNSQTKTYIDGKTISSISYTVESNITVIRFIIYASYSTPTTTVSSKYQDIILTKNNSNMSYEKFTGRNSFT